MIPEKDETSIDAAVRAGFDGSSLRGMRYVLPGRTDLEVMATRGGAGSMSVDDTILVQGRGTVADGFGRVDRH
jgi:hypothetical protein